MQRIWRSRIRGLVVVALLALGAANCEKESLISPRGVPDSPFREVVDAAHVRGGDMNIYYESVPPATR